jgi:hypothetical protein
MNQLLIIMLLGGSLAQAAKLEPYVCPDLSAGETQNDCPWAAVTRNLIADSSQAVMPRLERMLPEFHAQVLADSKKTALKELWGQSFNFDEIAKATTVHPSIIEALSGFFGVPAPHENIVHAGLEHTYGYLFSVLKTPFGYKRDRWVSGKIEKGLGMAPGIFGPNPSEGTLFTNVTYFAGRVAFREDAKQRAILLRTKDVPQALKQFDYDSLRTVRLMETVEVPPESGKGKPRQVTLRTDLVPFVQATPENAYLLVYSVVDQELRGPKLITAFQVDAAFGTRLLETELGDDKPIQSRYNAYVRGLSGKTIPGRKSVVQEKKRDQ